MLTWQAEDGHGLEGARVSFAHGFRAQGRLVRPDFTASYRLVVDEDGVLSRLSVTSDTAAQGAHPDHEPHRRRLLVARHRWRGRDRGPSWAAPSTSTSSTAPLFNTLPIRRLGLHREAGEHTLPMVFVTLPGLEVQDVAADLPHGLAWPTTTARR